MIGFFLALLLTAHGAETAMPQGLPLNADEWAKLQSQGQYARSVPNPKSSWPEMQVFALVKAPALESAGLFHALDYQKEYVPNLLESRPVRHVTPTEVHTAYVFKAPWPMSNAHYVHGTKIALEDQGPKVEWYMVQSDSAEDAHGYAQFRPLSSELSLLEYHAFIQPKSFFAGLVKKVAFKNTQEDVLAIVRHIELLVKDKSPLVTKYKDYYLRALKGEPVYKPVIEGSKK